MGHSLNSTLDLLVIDMEIDKKENRDSGHSDFLN